MNTNPFTIPAFAPGAGTPALRSAIGQVIATEPMARTSDGTGFIKPDPIFDNYRPNVVADMDDIRAGRLHFPRLAGVHRLLAEQFCSERVTALENGPDVIPHNAATMLELGAMVVIKETDKWAAGEHNFFLTHHHRDLLRVGRVKYMSGPEMVRETIEAHISYWVSPTPQIRRDNGRHGTLDYLGRDVVAGGFLVVQSDWASFDELDYDSSKWEQVFSTMLDAYGTGLVMVTSFAGGEHSFNVFRRLAEQQHS